MSDKELLREILSELKAIRRLLTPPEDPNVLPKQIVSDTKWTQIAQIPGNIYAWSLFNLSKTETLEVAYTGHPDDDAIKKLAPRQEISRDTRPKFIFAKRESGNTGTPYPVVVLEYWMTTKE